jgi:uncharacterized protein (TIGR02996 family)
MVKADRYYERHERAPVFVRLSQRGETLQRHWGRLGTAGYGRVEEHPSEAAASQALRLQCRRLERMGYRLGHHHPGFLQAILERPEEAEAYLVYADWLLERHDARGELIIRMAHGKRVDDLLEQHREQLAPEWWEGCRPEWAFGFVRKMTLQPMDPTFGRRLLRHPSLAVVRSLVILPPSPFASSGWSELLQVGPSTLTSVTTTTGEIVATRVSPAG